MRADALAMGAVLDPVDYCVITLLSSIVLQERGFDLIGLLMTEAGVGFSRWWIVRRARQPNQVKTSRRNSDTKKHGHIKQ